MSSAHARCAAGYVVAVAQAPFADTRFRQQKLAAWQPILTASTVIPVFCIVGIIFVPIGAILISVSANVQERVSLRARWLNPHKQVFNYTTCPAIDDQQNRSCAEILSQSSVVLTSPCQCDVHMRIDEAMIGDVYFYYALTNFYQNHRRYVRSRNDDQLLGHLDSVADCRLVPICCLYTQPPVRAQSI
jgi:hypothetical protein